MRDIETQIVAALDALRATRPLVHNITNYVVMHFSANALLGLGASPVMAHAVEEVEEMASIASSLVLNIGTLSAPWIEAMLLAGRRARERGIPVVLDPVGAGATTLRTTTAARILDEVLPTVLRGNPSEVLAVAGEAGATRGVDATQGVGEALRAAVGLARERELVVGVTGEVDLVTDGERLARVSNGHALMGRITGSGCVASALTGAFCAVEADPFVAATAALAIYGAAGEVAAESVPAPGPGTYPARLVDALDQLDASRVAASVRVRLEDAAS